ncbi:23S rRNA methyltransferase [Planctomycetota bacterium]|nr:23S rRNA methyltransferase [Planctomycetota bacterium]
MTIASTDNPLVRRLVRSAADGRRGERLVQVEGRRAIAELLAAGWRPEALLVREDLDLPPGWNATMASARVLAKVSQAATPSGYLAAFPLPPTAVLDPAAGGLVLAGLSDPGNVGTLLRTAAAFACRQVVIASGCDPWSAKVVQSTAGCLASLAIHDLGDQAAATIAGGAPCCGLVVAGGRQPADLPPGPRWLVVGNEAHGLPEAWQALCVQRLTLPMPGQAESLNAAVAGAIALWALGPGRTGG